MNTKTLLSATLLAYGLTCGPELLAQAPSIAFPSPSPTATFKQRVGVTDIEIVYSRPSAKGRTVFGSVVPFGEIWRTGANQATKITFSTPMKFSGTEVPAGSYSLYTIPGQDEWTIILNKNTGNWAGGWDKKDDVARVTVKPVKVSDKVETFTIDINDLRDDSATLNLLWENVRVPIKLGVDLMSKLMPQIESAMAASGGNKPYYQAAAFYYDHGQDLQKARKWADAAVAQNQAYFTLHLQAKILAKLGDKAGALAAANRSIELAKAAKDGAYVRLNEALIASLK